MKRLGIQQKIVILFLVFFIPVVALCIWQQVRYYALMRQNVSEYTTQLIDKISYDIERGMKELDSALMDVLYDASTAELLLTPEDSEASDTVALALGNARSRLRMNTMADCNIVLLSNNRKVIQSTYDEWTGSDRTLSAEWLDKIIRAEGGRVGVSAYSIRRESGSTVKVVGIARSVRSGRQRCGILLLEIPLDYFYSLCNGIEYGAGGSLMLVDNDDFVIYSTDAAKIGSRFTLAGEVERSTASILEGPNELVYSVPMAGLGGSIRTVAVVSRAQMEASIDQMFRQMLLLIGALGVCLLLVFVLTARSFCHPIISICGAMRQLESGNFQMRVQPTAKDEVGDLQRGFNHMAEQLGELVEREYVARVREREAQLKDLIRMMDPHFMYNTLEAISMTAYLSDDQKTVQMLDHLADMYRFSSGQGERTTLREELKNAEDYLYLINIRCDGKIRFHKHIAERLLDCECLKFVLQPLLENSIVHGFGEAQSAGDIWLDVHEAQAGTIELTVQDNGAGLQEDTLQSLRTILADDKIEMENYPSMAVKNIHDRLRLSYGACCGVDVSQAPQGGAQIRLTYPLIQREGGEHDHCDFGGR